MFQNQAFAATFQNLPPDAIFCDYASDLYHEWYSVLLTPDGGLNLLAYTRTCAATAVA